MKVRRTVASSASEQVRAIGRWRRARDRMGYGVVLVVLLAGMPPTWPISGVVSAQALPAAQPSKEAVIVEVAPSVDPEVVARALGVAPKHIYNKVFHGFAAELPAGAVLAAERQRSVGRIWPDLPVQAEVQTLPTGVDRIDADKNEWSDIDGTGAGINADVAVIDTGIATHPELTVAGGVSCVPGNPSYADDNGHGTHVAGTIGAMDNDEGVVGVAPGARLWAVKVLDSNGEGSISSLICGLEWVADNATVIDVVNLSLSAKADAADQKPCGGEETTPLHSAICDVVNAGVPFVVAAGNQGRNASTRVPATYQEVITVSAFKDFDGEPGSKGKPTCEGGRDDTFAGFSNYGRDIDIAAPGVCIESTRLGGGTQLLSGTSMAAPHVTGAVALYVANGPGSGQDRPAAVRDWLLTEASRPQKSRYGFTRDKDNHRERVLYIGPQ